MRSFFLLLVILSALLSLHLDAHAFRVFGIGNPSARQRQRYAYMLNGRRVRRPHHGPQPAKTTAHSPVALVR